MPTGIAAARPRTRGLDVKVAVWRVYGTRASYQAAACVRQRTLKSREHCGYASFDKYKSPRAAVKAALRDLSERL